jgi:DNA-directed RNA polymerase subunit beta'
MKKGIIESIVLKLASPEEILEWSRGEVLKPETINYRTGRPERDGLFSEVIFGPTRDYECYCGKYRKPTIRGITCERCGVEVTASWVRRERMGHITLMTPVAHIWFLRSYPYPISLFLDIPLNQLEKVIYYSAYVIVRVDEKEKEKILKNLESEFKEILSQAKSLQERREKKELFRKIKEEIESIQPKKVLSDVEYFQLSRKYPNLFEVSTGAEPIRRFLEEIDLNQLKKDLEKKLSKATGDEKRKIALKLKFVKAFIKHNRRPEWMILTILPVIPPDLRPIVRLEEGRYVSSDLNELYRRVINRNNRLKRLIEMGAPEIILRNEKRMLQEAVDALLDNSLKKEPVKRGLRKALKSLADSLKGKQGRFRQNLLGKRVDYSGRAVIVVGPELRINECGLPKKMALELFKPFIIHELLKDEIASTIKKANYLIESMAPEALAALEKVVADKFVLLNRPPTLHRLGVQAFKPILTEGLAIRIPPLVCTGYNADFDGDQMGVFLPLSEDAQREARELLNAAKNILKPGTGEAIANPNKDMVWGIYYLTLIEPKAKGEGKKIFDAAEAKRLYELGEIDLRAKVIVKNLKNLNNVETTVGRVIFNEFLPDDYPYINKIIDKKVLADLVEDIYNLYGDERTAIFLDSIKDLGFKYATYFGASISYMDTKVAEGKNEIIQEAIERESKVVEAYENGLLSEEEKKAKVTEIWYEVFDKIKDNLQKSLDVQNPTRSMIDSGARGSWENITQVMGLKGLVKDPKGEIIDLPVIESYQEGLSVLSYFISTHGARKGTADTSLKTSHAGYLTRRMEEVAHDVIIKERDCGTDEGIVISRKESEEWLDKFLKRIYSRVLLEDVYDKKGNLVAKKDSYVTKDLAKKIDESGVDEVKVRSPFTCKTIYGLCAKCYGINLADGKPIKLGEAVGIMAAQSIGEPGTQLTMRTFHTGGIAMAADITSGVPRANELFEARSPSFLAIQSPVKGIVESIESNVKYYEITIKYKKGKKIERLKIKIPRKFKLVIKKGSHIEKGEILNEGVLDPKMVYRIQGKMAAFKYLISELKKLYNSQGAEVHDKHFEVILRKMFSLVKIIEPGDSDFVAGEIIEKDWLLEVNQDLRARGLKPAKGILLLRGISDVAVNSQSFLAAASFQNTVRVLTRAALECREDKLRGIKENVIIGRKPPIGEEFYKLVS